MSKNKVEVANKKLLLSHMMSDPNKHKSPSKFQTEQDSELVQLNKILKFGTENIFSEESIKSGDTEYSDQFIDALCDRKRIFEEESKEESKPHEKQLMGINDYFNMFKDAQLIDTSKDENDGEWEDLIGKELKEMKEQEMLFMGKGMRKRDSKVKYFQDQEEGNEQLSEYDAKEDTPDVDMEDEEACKELVTETHQRK